MAGTCLSRPLCNVAIIIFDRPDSDSPVQLPVGMVGAIDELPLQHLVPVVCLGLLQSRGYVSSTTT
ncbi:hypothetical protein THTE_3004 [Thermogutta terrifontis]|uniref:Uncharacterized protein n=1 Tax=Thermogutta terrifontis TaxID=1331910 RepID=A0A286RI52_9BACT|nr:hypothetical protein THTE_3004 [Thermogutta terrifontis]